MSSTWIAFVWLLTMKYVDLYVRDGREASVGTGKEVCFREYSHGTNNGSGWRGITIDPKRYPTYKDDQCGWHEDLQHVETTLTFKRELHP